MAIVIRLDVMMARRKVRSNVLARAIGITQKSAWHVLHSIRHAMTSGTFEKFTGTVESDETFVGGKSSNMHLSRRREKIRSLTSGDNGATVVKVTRCRHARCSQQQPMVISSNSGAPKASCGIGAPWSVAQHRRPASNSTMTTPTTKITISVVSR